MNPDAPGSAASGGMIGRVEPPVGAVDLLIVVVNYRSAELAIDCLRSLEPAVRARGRACVALVENQSGVDQAERLRAAIEQEGWEDWVTLLRARRNGGFAAGNNIALGWARTWPEPPERVWLLNPDTIVRPGALAALEAFLEAHPGVGLAGSRLEDPDGTPQNSAFRFPSVLGEVEGGLRFGPASRLLRDHAVVRPLAHSPQAVDWVAGASLIIRRAVFDRIGLLDEGYFMYFEEVDFCRRARRAGWPCWYVPESRVVHLVGQSSAVTSAAGARKRRPRYWFDARQRYFRTHHGRFGTFAANLLHVAAFGSYRLRSKLQRKVDNDPRHLLWDLIRFNLLAGKR